MFGVLEAVVGAHGELHLVDALAEPLVEDALLLVRHLDHRAFRLLLVLLLDVDEDLEVVLHELGGEPDRVARGDGPVASRPRG